MLSKHKLYKEKIDSIIDQIKKGIANYQQNLVLVFAQHQKEWELHNANLGKILLVTGAQSSGKTTLISKLLFVIPNLHTVNRVELIHQTHTLFDKLLFDDLLREVSYILGYSVNGIQFYELQINKINLKPNQQTFLEQLHNAFKEITDSDLLFTAFRPAIFIAYYNAMKKHLFSGNNIILDDSLLVSEEIYNQFKSCCGNYPYVRRVLLFATIETNLYNCIIRNNKFADKVVNYPLEKSVSEILKEQEIASGGSSDSYRFPKSIIKAYKTNYNIETSNKSGDIVLASSSKEEMLAIFHQIAKEQLKILGLLAYRKPPIKEDYVDAYSEINELFQNNTRVYFFNKTRADYIVDASAIYYLEGMQLLKHLDKLMEWFSPSLNLRLTDEQTILLSKYKQHIISVSSIEDENIKFLYPGIKDILYYQLGIEHNIAIVNTSINIHQLNHIITLIIKDVLIEKIVYIPISIQKNGLTQIISKFNEDKKIKFIYYSPTLKALEHDPMALALIPIFLFNAKKCGFSIDILDSRYLTSNDSNMHSLTLDEFIFSLSRCNFYKEFSLWSKYFGKIIVINGVSCVGKTTLATSLSKFGYNKISIDDIFVQYAFTDLWNVIPDKMLYAQRALINETDILKTYLGMKVNRHQYSLEQINIIDDLVINIIKVAGLFPKHSLMEMNDKIYNEAKKFIFSGQNVVVDTILSTQDQVDLFSYCCSYYPISIILLYSSLEENVKKCFVRNEVAFEHNLLDFRNPAGVIDQYFTFYTCISKAEYINLPDKIIEKADKTVINKILKLVSKHIPFICKSTWLDFNRIEESTKYSMDLIERVKDKMELLSKDEDINVISSIKYDYIVINPVLGDLPQVLQELL